jgi:GABA(A) receptor-associated protein
MSSFKQKHTLEHLKAESARIMAKYPDRIPVVVERGKKSKLVEIDKNKFLVPSDLTVGQFLYVIRKRIKIQPEKALFIFVNGILPSSSLLMCSLYKEQKDESGFLFCEYYEESTFGSNL